MTEESLNLLAAMFFTELLQGRPKELKVVLNFINDNLNQKEAVPIINKYRNQLIDFYDRTYDSKWRQVPNSEWWFWSK